MDSAQKTEYTKALLSLIPESGTSIGNFTLREQLRKRIESNGGELSDQDYRQLRDSLIDDGLIVQGRGRGGSVHRVLAKAEEEPPPLIQPPVPISNATYIRHSRQPLHRDTSRTTGSNGSFRKSLRHKDVAVQGGRWTRPDLTLIAVRTYSFTPGKRLEVITFEVKPNLDTALEGVFEALAHSVFAHRSYLAVDISDFKADDQIPDDRIVARMRTS